MNRIDWVGPHLRAWVGAFLLLWLLCGTHTLSRWSMRLCHGPKRQGLLVRKADCEDESDEEMNGIKYPEYPLSYHGCDVFQASNKNRHRLGYNWHKFLLGRACKLLRGMRRWREKERVRCKGKERRWRK